jgi:hypothetical protein
MSTWTEGLYLKLLVCRSCRPSDCIDRVGICPLASQVIAPVERRTSKIECCRYRGLVQCQHCPSICSRGTRGCSVWQDRRPCRISWTEVRCCDWNVPRIIHYGSKWNRSGCTLFGRVLGRSKRNVNWKCGIVRDHCLQRPAFLGFA